MFTDVLRLLAAGQQSDTLKKPKWLFVTCLFLAAAILGFAAPNYGRADGAIHPGDKVVTTEECAVQVGTETLATVPPKTRLVATDVQGDWVAVVVERGGKNVSGWIQARQLARVPSAATEGTTTPSASCPVTIPDLQEGKLAFKDLTLFRELVVPGGKESGYFSNKKLQFDEEASVFRFGSQQSRIEHSGDALQLSDPVTVTLAMDDPLKYAKSIGTAVPPSSTIVWIEPSKDGRNSFSAQIASG